MISHRRNNTTKGVNFPMGVNKSTTTLVSLLLSCIIILLQAHQRVESSGLNSVINYDNLYSANSNTKYESSEIDIDRDDNEGKGLKSDLYNPVIFIPGYAGSQLEAKLNKSSRIHYICPKESDWFDLWLNLHLLGPYYIDCLIDNMMLIYNHSTRTTRNNEGVDIRATNFGSLSSVAYLDIFRIYNTDYFENIIAKLEKRNGFVRDSNMFGAAYDFRKAPNELAEHFKNLTDLIETKYISGNYRPITLICHSMGCLNTVYFLNHKTQNWRDVFIKRLVTLGAPWDGAMNAVVAMLFGDNLGIPLLSTEKLKTLSMSFPSLVYLFPKQPSFQLNRTLVSTPNKTYSLSNLKELFLDVDMIDQYEMWKDTNNFTDQMKPPNVEMWCLYGAKVQTVSEILVEDTFEKRKYSTVFKDGDGTVNLESLKACERFAGLQKKPVFTHMFERINHIDILRSDAPANFISQNILTRDLPDRKAANVINEEKEFELMEEKVRNN